MGFVGKDIRTAKHAKVSLSLQPLEPRVMLSGDGWLSTASLVVAPAWFERTPDYSGGVQGTLGDYGTELRELRGRTVEVVKDQWIVQFTGQAAQSVAGVAESATLLSGGIEFTVLQGLGMQGQILISTRGAEAGAVESWLSANPNVAMYTPNALIQPLAVPDDTNFAPNQWHLNNTGQSGGIFDADIDAVEAWDTTTGSSGIVVGVIDTGVDYTHPDLVDNIWVNQLELGGTPGVDDDGNGFIDDVYGWDFFADDADPMDENGHGTHVAGTIGAAGNNAMGVTGVAWDVSIMALRFLGPEGGLTSGAIAAINYATMMKAEFDNGDGDGNPGANVLVTNNSWGGGGFEPDLQTAIAAYGAVGGLFIAAAGNEGMENDLLPHYPSSYDLPNIISVAATDHNDRLASFSNYGVRSVDVAAPGHGIYSTWLAGTYASFLSGTSMATPVVAGIAVLAWSANPAASMEQVRDAILAGAEYMPWLDGLVATGGRVNALATVQRVMFDDPINIPVAAFVSAPVSVTIYDTQGFVNVDPLAVDVRFGGGQQIKSVTFGGGPGQDGVGVVISGASFVKKIQDNRAGMANITYVVSNSPVGSIKLRSGVTGANLNGAVLDGQILPDDIDGDGVTSDFTGIYIDGQAGKVDIPRFVPADLYFGGLGQLKVKGSVLGDTVVDGNSGKISMAGTAIGAITVAGSSSQIDIGGSQWMPIRVGGNSGKLSIGGAMEGYWDSNLVSTIDIGGSAADIRVGGAIWFGSHIVMGGTLGALRSASIMGFDVSEGGVNMLGVQVLAGFSIGKVDVGGTVSGLRMLAGAELGADLQVGGLGADADTYRPASIGSFRVKHSFGLYGGVGSVTNSLIAAGATPVMGELNLAYAEAYAGFLLGSIGKVDIAGQIDGPGIGAYTFGSLKVGGISRIQRRMFFGPALPVYYTVL